MASGLLEMVDSEQGVRAEGPKLSRDSNMGDRKLSNSEIKRMVKLIGASLGMRPKLQFSKRLHRPACYQRSFPVVVPVNGFTESELIHDLAHVVQLEQHRSRPHGLAHQEQLERLKTLWTRLRGSI